MNIQPIHNNNDYKAALERVEMLMDAEPGTDAGNELEILSILIDDYENHHWYIEKPSAIAAIKFCMEQRGLSQVDLVPIIGSKSKVSETLSGKRDLSLSMIQRLHDNLGIPFKILLQPAKNKSIKLYTLRKKSLQSSRTVSENKNCKTDAYGSHALNEKPRGTKRAASKEKPTMHQKHKKPTIK